ncbi:MAG TPA: 30S ribosomal protein S9 [Anaerolineales bacterium]|uniref:Small ribosomal subunit protein uS9 n=1 Tax=uncultured Chloroflexi bacterium Rifle_16ft_4_minimus_6153 TaxID=1665079 RepID=A0A0H4T9G3_9CHLR|nr:30S ribosomal protein S9, small subunit ribosomal protein S9 [uncultured Chloroflexi bacterium Rifle_16ft_4_minimus_6153]HLE30585.1 30S ribosomal protein S9 [Anaerolineales bacterium]
MANQYYEGVGRRKTSTARVRLFSGDGAITCNDKAGQAYFTRVGDLEQVTAPLKATGVLGRYNVSIKVTGGGVTGQAGAAQMGVARALLKLNPEYNKPLRKGGFLTRDDRMKERKKPGLKRARKAPTFTKR